MILFYTRISKSFSGRRMGYKKARKKRFWEEKTRTVKSLFVPKHPVLEPWNPRVRMKVEVGED